MEKTTRALLDDPETQVRGVYLAGPSGFNAAGLLWHNEVLLPKVRAAGLLALDPWADQTIIRSALSRYRGTTRKTHLRQANLEQGRLDLEMVRTCAAVLATLDGAQVDDGTALEIGYAHCAGKLIVGLRTDIRIASDNEGASVNLMIETCVEDSGGIITRYADEAVEFVRNALVP